MVEKPDFAIVIPFCSLDTRDLLKNMSIWCQSDKFISDTQKHNIDLVLYYCANSESDQIDPVIIETANSYCDYFQNIVSERLILTPSQYKYPIGPGLMFFNMIENTTYKVFFYMEPDCVPVKNGWLDEVESSCRMMLDRDVWVQATLYNGSFRSNDLPTKLHFNGNSIFNVSGDGRQLIKKIKGCINISQNYDFAIMNYLNSVQGYDDFRDYMYHVIYSPMVLNFGRQPILKKYLNSYPTKTYFLHGKNVVQLKLKN